jgi:hypothetical protein
MPDRAPDPCLGAEVTLDAVDVAGGPCRREAFRHAPAGPRDVRVDFRLLDAAVRPGAAARYEVRYENATGHDVWLRFHPCRSIAAAAYRDGVRADAVMVGTGGLGTGGACADRPLEVGLPPGGALVHRDRFVAERRLLGSPFDEPRIPDALEPLEPATYELRVSAPRPGGTFVHETFRARLEVTR